ncbi:MAG: ATPase [Nitrospirota bacterium]|nr:ATPase [Nitrospirota bacterium]
MIIRMSKIEIAGPKDLLQQVLSLLRELGLFQVEPAAIGFIDSADEQHVRSFSLDEKTTIERLYLEDLRLKIDDLVSLLPHAAVRESYIDPPTVIEALARMVDHHTVQARELSERRDALQKERVELERNAVFLSAVASLLQSAKETPNLEFIGLTVRDPAMVGNLREAISRITDWKYEFQTGTAGDGTVVGLITVEKAIADKVKRSLADEQVPELTFPAAFGSMTFTEKIAYVNQRKIEAAAEIEGATAAQERFAHRWLPLYRSVRDWIDGRLSLLRTTASAYETKMCFFIHGWMPSRDLERIRGSLLRSLGPQVVVEEKEMREQDLEHVPIALRNPAYFRPFELMTSLLPLPAYRSYDPTPFIGIFFPIFFGIILGDAGYGLVLLLGAWYLRKRFRGDQRIHDGGTILMISSGYTIFFGVLFGEFFGDLPERLFHLQPLCVERRTAIVPMLIFSLAIGAGHVVLGLLLGAMNAFQRNLKREGLFKALSIVVIFLIAAVLASFFGVFPLVLKRPAVLLILFLTPLLLFAGGILAPLEFLKSIGNIISYVRITAIGLTSVLLAYVANQLGGLTGDVVLGVVVAGLIHGLNIVLGVFSPTIHSLRLHYVEFFSKFVEHGGRKFEPLKK